MRHFLAFIVVITLILVSLSAELIAQGRGGVRVQGPKTPATHGPKTIATAPRTTARALPKNQKLVERLRTLLKTNPDMNEAASGFRNQGQFVAAVHASANHGLSFTELKKRMVDRHMSLGQAMKDMRRNIDADAEASVAVQQASQDLADASPKRRTASRRR